MKKIIFLIIISLIMPLTLLAAEMDLSGFAPPEGLTSHCSYNTLHDFIQLAFIVLSVLILFIWLIVQHKKLNKPKIDSIVKRFILWASPVFLFIVFIVLIFRFSDTLRSSSNLFIKNLGYLSKDFGAFIFYFILYLIIVYLLIFIIRFIVSIIKKDVAIKKFFWLLFIIIVLSAIYVLAFLPGWPGKKYVDTLCRQHSASFYGQPTFTDEDPPFTATDLDTYCGQRTEENLQVRSLGIPTDYINNHELKTYLEAWKEIFIEYNRLTPEYFDQHIRIKDVGLKDIPLCDDEFYAERCAGGINEYMEIDYYVVFDWAQIEKRDGFSIKYGTDNDSTKEEVIERLRKKIKHKEDFYQSGGYDRAGYTNSDINEGWVISLSSIRNRQGESDMDTFNYGSRVDDLGYYCEQAVMISSGLAGERILNIGSSFRMKADGPVLTARYFAGENSCPQITLYLDKGEYSVNTGSPCAIIFY